MTSRATAPTACFDDDDDANSVLELYDVSETRMKVLSYVDDLEAEQARREQEEEDYWLAKQMEQQQQQQAQNERPSRRRSSLLRENPVDSLSDSTTSSSGSSREERKQQGSPKAQFRHSHASWTTEATASMRTLYDDDDDEAEMNDSLHMTQSPQNSPSSTITKKSGRKVKGSKQQTKKQSQKDKEDAELLADIINHQDAMAKVKATTLLPATTYSNFVEGILEDASIITRRNNNNNTAATTSNNNNNNRRPNATCQANALISSSNDMDDDGAELIADIINSQDAGKCQKLNSVPSRVFPTSNSNNHNIVRAVSGLTAYTTFGTIATNATSNTLANEASEFPELNRNLRLLPPPGVVAVVPPNRPAQSPQNDDDDDVEAGTSSQVVLASSSSAAPQHSHHQQPIMATLVTEEELLQEESMLAEASRAFSVEAVPADKDPLTSKHNRLLMAMIGLLFVVLIVVVGVTVGGSQKKKSNPNDLGPPLSPPATTSDKGNTAAPMDTNQEPTGSSFTASSSASESSSASASASSVLPQKPRGNLQCGTKALGQLDYRGTLSTTITGIPCQPWDDKYPWNHNRQADAGWADRGLESNYCRNPDGDTQAWCYTMDPNVRTEICDVPDCNYCGVDFQDAQSNCKSTCMSDDECPNGESCFEGTTCERPAEHLDDVGNSLFYCGMTFEDAQNNCRQPCSSGYSNECPAGESCFEATGCVQSGPASYCGFDLDHADNLCAIPCERGSSSQCPQGMSCFANTSCSS